METINLNEILERKHIEKNIEYILNNFNKDEKYKRGIYIYGDSGIGKTKFIINLLKKLNYDVIYYDNSLIRNKSLIDNIGSQNLSNSNVYSMFTNKPKKIVIVIDDIDGMNYGDKNGIISLIKLIRIKKTKKQKLENLTNNPIICINNKNNDKKILELMKVCHVFELKNPSNNQLLEIINSLLPNIFKYKEYENALIKKNILDFLNNNLISINKILFYEKNDIIYKKFYENYKTNINESNENIKIITKDFLENKYTFDKINNILESDRTILSLLFHENIIQILGTDNLNIYLKILENFIFSDYIDRIIFQKQIWQLTEMNYIIKLFQNNYILTNNNLLKEQNVHIWDGNSSRDYLDSRGLSHYKEDELGPVYGWQWRRFNEPYTGEKQENDGNHPGDQLMYIINHLKDPEKRTSRRLIMSAWNILQMEEMALPPCHILVQFNVFDGNKLSCSMYQRSGDVGLGVPFNIASYSFLTHLIAKHCGLEAYEFFYHIGNCHIYDDHIDALQTQIQREPMQFPTVHVKTIHDTLEEYQFNDFEINDYVCHKKVKMEMRK